MKKFNIKEWRNKFITENPEEREWAPEEEREDESIDFEYFSDQIDGLINDLRDFHRELGTPIEMKGDETGFTEYKTMEQQISRYIRGAEKQLTSLQRFIEKRKGRGL